MARVKFSPDEFDQDFQIEDGIRATLAKSSTAEVSVSVIEKAYSSGTLQQKCEALARKLGAQYSQKGDDIVFVRRP